MNKYQNGKIYKIVSSQTEQCYVGSTTQSLTRRFKEHHSGFKNNSRTTSKIIMKYDDAHMVLLEEYPCNSKIELEQRERYYIESMLTCNKHIPTRTIKEYMDNNREKRNKYRKEWSKNNIQKTKEWYVKNKVRLLQKNKQYYEHNKEKIKQYRQNNKEKKRQTSKEWRENNKETLKKKKKIYYQYVRSWGPYDTQHYHTNLLQISPDIFK